MLLLTFEIWNVLFVIYILFYNTGNSPCKHRKKKNVRSVSSTICGDILKYGPKKFNIESDGLNEARLKYGKKKIDIALNSTEITEFFDSLPILRLSRWLDTG